MSSRDGQQLLQGRRREARANLLLHLLQVPLPRVTRRAGVLLRAEGAASRTDRLVRTYRAVPCRALPCPMQCSVIITS